MASAVPRLEEVRKATERLTLRRLTLADQAAFVAMLDESAEAWAPWTPSPPDDLTPADRFRREIERGASGARAGTHLRLGAFAPEGRLIGLFSLNEIVRGVFESAYAGWQVRATDAGRGLGTEGVSALLDIAFAAPPRGLGLHRVQANIMPSNAASLGVARKVGFRREGEALRYLRIAGRWEDHVMFALTADEWPRGA
ncbi:MAG: GNAT family N-acetyltransferase [Gemmatimonadetes bacterium]|nr:GNAT family N-acetyltransferase [Gemmatimonadota bacterium]